MPEQNSSLPKPLPSVAPITPIGASAQGNRKAVIQPPSTSPIASNSYSSSRLQNVENSSVNWRAIIAGVFISLLSYGILMSLGLAIGGAKAQGFIAGTDDASGFGMGTGIWLVTSVLISLFIGSFAAGRASGLIPMRLGRTQGAVIAALFFGILLSQIGGAVGLLGKGLGSTLGAVGGAAGSLVQNDQVQGIANRVIGNSTLQSPPGVVIEGLATRLVRGDSEGAATYLSQQTGISRAEADQRLQSVRSDTDRIARDVGTKAAKAVSTAGWTLFGALVLGLGASVLGGGSGAGFTLRKSMSDSDRQAVRINRAA
ncbi:MAG: hypothetical protein H7222_01745 [Methylotenera sp.]|nr:hypothetical protein [Oligoflexia bacterium]